MRILLSIKPEYAWKIFNGTKKFEFRKTMFNKKIDVVLVYATAPVKKVIGEFKCECILSDHPQQLWNKTHPHSGISYSKFEAYFTNIALGHALKVTNPILYETPKTLEELNIRTAPQSFVYLH